MKYLAILLMALTIGCTNNNNEKEIHSTDTNSVGIDSTKIGADSGILRKLP